MSEGRLQGKVAVIAGAGGAMGSAVAYAAASGDQSRECCRGTTDICSGFAVSTGRPFGGVDVSRRR